MDKKDLKLWNWVKDDPLSKWQALRVGGDLRFLKVCRSYGIFIKVDTNGLASAGFFGPMISSGDRVFFSKQFDGQDAAVNTMSEKYGVDFVAMLR